MELIKWRKARRSGGQGDACVEVARFPGGIGIRDSKAPDAGHFTLTPHAFHTLLNNLKH